MTKKVVEIIQYHIDNKMILNIERNNISKNEKIHGFPIMLTEDYLLMTNIYDFHDEGYIILRNIDITDAYSKESELFYESICLKEGLDKKTENIFLNEMNDFKSILTQLNGYDGYIAIHCELEDEKCNFFLGKIDKIMDEGIDFYSIGVDGEWDEMSEYISFDDITMVSVEDYYSKMFYKYSKKR